MPIWNRLELGSGERFIGFAGARHLKGDDLFNTLHHGPCPLMRTVKAEDVADEIGGIGSLTVRELFAESRETACGLRSAERVEEGTQIRSAERGMA